MADLFKEIIPDINYGHKNLIRTGDMDESEYGKNCFIINRALSMNVDTVLYVNEMNVRYQLDPVLQYDYFINSLRQKKGGLNGLKQLVHHLLLNLLKAIIIIMNKGLEKF